LILTQPLAALFLVFAFMGLCGPTILSKIVKKPD
jgi:hypothetical protein